MSSLTKEMWQELNRLMLCLGSVNRVRDWSWTDNYNLIQDEIDDHLMKITPN